MKEGYNLDEDTIQENFNFNGIKPMILKSYLIRVPEISWNKRWKKTQKQIN